jgi:ribonucleotide monophosphatase NagD (HAD superfamily)
VGRILPGSTIGFLGGGQLGRMTAFAARAMGYDVHVLDPDPTAPARAVATRFIEAPFDDADAIVRLAEGSAVLMPEIETISADGMARAVAHAPVRPGAKVLHIGHERDLTFYEGLDAQLVPEAEAELISCTGLYDDTVETPDNYHDLFGRLVARRLPMVCANPDIVVERGDKLVYCGGALARLYGEMGGEAILAGKPHAPIYTAAKKMIKELGGSRLLAVGDGLPTDIRGAVDNGVPVLFVTGGIHAADFGPHDNPDGDRVAARLHAEGLSAAAYLPALAWADGARR